MESHVLPSGEIASDEHITSSIEKNKGDTMRKEDVIIHHNIEESYDKKMHGENIDKVCITLITLMKYIISETINTHTHTHIYI